MSFPRSSPTCTEARPSQTDQLAARLPPSRLARAPASRRRARRTTTRSRGERARVRDVLPESAPESHNALRCSSPRSQTAESSTRLTASNSASEWPPMARARQYRRSMQDLADRGVQGILLGCAELDLLVGPRRCRALVETTRLHARRAVDVDVGAKRPARLDTPEPGTARRPPFQLRSRSRRASRNLGRRRRDGCLGRRVSHKLRALEESTTAAWAAPPVRTAPCRFSGTSPARSVDSLDDPTTNGRWRGFMRHPRQRARVSSVVSLASPRRPSRPSPWRPGPRPFVNLTRRPHRRPASEPPADARAASERVVEPADNVGGSSYRRTPPRGRQEQPNLPPSSYQAWPRIIGGPFNTAAARGRPTRNSRTRLASLAIDGDSQIQR